MGILIPHSTVDGRNSGASIGCWRPDATNTTPSDRVTVHAIESAITMGEDRPIMGHLIVEMQDGSMHRITGAEMTDWTEALSHFVQKWRLVEEDGVWGDT